MSSNKDDTARLLIGLAALMFTVTIAAFVILAVSNSSTATLERLAGPLLTAVIVTGVVGASHKSQEGKLDQIQHQTNGRMDKRIRDGVNAVLDEREAKGK